MGYTYGYLRSDTSSVPVPEPHATWQESGGAELSDLSMTLRAGTAFATVTQPIPELSPTISWRLLRRYVGPGMTAGLDVHSVLGYGCYVRTVHDCLEREADLLCYAQLKVRLITSDGALRYDLSASTHPGTNRRIDATWRVTQFVWNTLGGLPNPLATEAGDRFLFELGFSVSALRGLDPESFHVSMQVGDPGPPNVPGSDNSGATGCGWMRFPDSIVGANALAYSAGWSRPKAPTHRPCVIRVGWQAPEASSQNNRFALGSRTLGR